MKGTISDDSHLTQEDFEKFEAIKTRINQDNRFFQLSRMKVTEVRQGYARVEMNINDQILNIYNKVHGGTIFSLTSTAAGTASFTTGQESVTQSASMNFIRPGTGGRLIAIASEISAGCSIGTYEVFIFNDHEKLLAGATFSMFFLDDHHCASTQIRRYRIPPTFFVSMFVRIQVEKRFCLNAYEFCAYESSIVRNASVFPVESIYPASLERSEGSHQQTAGYPNGGIIKMVKNTFLTTLMTLEMTGALVDEVKADVLVFLEGGFSHGLVFLFTPLFNPKRGAGYTRPNLRLLKKPSVLCRLQTSRQSGCKRREKNAEKHGYTPKGRKTRIHAEGRKRETDEKHGRRFRFRRRAA